MEYVQEMYQVIAFNEYLNTEVLKEKYNEELISQGYEPIYEDVRKSIKEGFKKVIDILKNIIEKIIHFVTITIPGVIKKFISAIASIGKRRNDTVKVNTSGMSDKAKAKTETLAAKANAINKKEAKIIALSTAVAVSSDVAKNKLATSKQDSSKDKSGKSVEEKITETRKEIGILKKDFSKEFDEFMNDPDSRLVFGDKIEGVKTIKKAVDQSKGVLLLEDKEAKKKWVGIKGYFYDRKIYEEFMNWFEKGFIKNINNSISDAISDFIKYGNFVTTKDVKNRIVHQDSNYLARSLDSFESCISDLDEKYSQLSKTLGIHEYLNVTAFYTKDGMIDDLKDSSKYFKIIEEKLQELYKINDIENKNDKKYNTIVNNYLNETARMISLYSKNINKIAQILIEINKNVLFFNANKTDIYTSM